MALLVTYRIEGPTAVITMDDGKVNALSLPMLMELNAALDEARAERRVAVLTGREGVFSAGFDLAILREVAAAAPGARIVASGGAGTLDHLRALAGLPGLAGAIAGTALYERRFGIAEGQAALAMGAFEGDPREASGDARAGQLHTFRAEDEDATAQELFPRKEPGAC